MEAYSSLQSLLLQWFRHHGQRSVSQIRSACKSLIHSFDVECNAYMYHLFFPLVRIGFIEFTGQGRYEVANPIVIYDKKDKLATGINLTSGAIESLKQSVDMIDPIDSFGIIRFKSTTSQLKAIYTELQVDYMENSISQILAQVPDFRTYISKLSKTPFPENYYLLNLYKHDWKKVSEPSCPGIYKASKDAFRHYFILENGDCHLIHEQNIHPDCRYICEAYQGIMTVNRQFVSYNRRERELRVKVIQIPIVLDRILRIPSLHLLDGVSVCGNERVYKNININAFRQLNRIFCDGIKKI
ncbi:MAG: hypothetical protein HQK65_05765 [Desulfamplus sp.]|nr:hypothetical protein [Desulfamplus sp.]